MKFDWWNPKEQKEKNMHIQNNLILIFKLLLIFPFQHQKSLIIFWKILNHNSLIHHFVICLYILKLVFKCFLYDLNFYRDLDIYLLLQHEHKECFEVVQRACFHLLLPKLYLLFAYNSDYHCILLGIKSIFLSSWWVKCVVLKL